MGIKGHSSKNEFNFFMRYFAPTELVSPERG